MYFENFCILFTYFGKFATGNKVYDVKAPFLWI